MKLFLYSGRGEIMSNFAHYSSAESPQKLEACLEVDMLGFELCRYLVAPQLSVIITQHIISI